MTKSVSQKSQLIAPNSAQSLAPYTVLSNYLIAPNKLFTTVLDEIKKIKV